MRIYVVIIRLDAQESIPRMAPLLTILALH